MSFSYFLIWSIFIPFLFGIFNYKKLVSLKWLFFYISYGVGNEIINRILVKSGIKNTLPLVHLYVIFSILFLTLFFQEVLKGFLKRIWFKSIRVLFGVFYLIDIFYFQSLYDYPNIPFSVLSIIILVFSLLYFYKTMIEAKIVKLADEPLIWINTGIVIFFTGNFFYHIFFNFFLKSSQEFLLNVGTYFRILIAIYYILITIGFMKAKRQIQVGGISSPYFKTNRF